MISITQNFNCAASNSLPRQAFPLSELRSSPSGLKILYPSKPGRLEQLTSAAIRSVRKMWSWC